MSDSKSVKIIARIQFKDDSRKVVYKVQSSNGQDVYETFLFDGKACSCRCKSRKPCYHMLGCEQAEQARKAETSRAAYVQQFDPCEVM